MSVRDNVSEEDNGNDNDYRNDVKINAKKVCYDLKNSKMLLIDRPTTARQCDQMLELKVAQKFPKVNRKIATVNFYLKCNVFKQGQKVSKVIVVTFVRNAVTMNFQKLTNLVTLSK